MMRADPNWRELPARDVRRRGGVVVLILLAFAVADALQAEDLVRLEGRIVDAATGRPLAARLYLQDGSNRWRLVQSASRDGSAVPYEKQRMGSVEIHTTLSAHPFKTTVPPGKYTLIAERGKEYFPERREITVEGELVDVTLKLRRWIDMASRGWYSGDTHVHRALDELPNIVLAEDLNVSFPLLYWVTRAFAPPDRGDKSTAGGEEPKVIHVDDTHVIWPRNTEYEIFSVSGKRHTLGAFFLLGHRSVFTRGTPPVRGIAETAHREGALIELDKHNWPWSMCLVPVMKVDLYEITNNHLWRAEFAFRQFGEPAAPYMKIETDGRGMTEWGWIDYGLKNYYALLNCGFRLRPTAGTASGVHPVPLGFGRVYVEVEGEFSYRAWLEGLGRGRSFVTTGPMLFVETDDRLPGHTFRKAGPARMHVEALAISETPLDRLEVVVNGEVREVGSPENRKLLSGAWESGIDTFISCETSSWIAVRAVEKRSGGRYRFAHSGPVYVDVDGRPLRPRREEVEFLVKRVEAQIERSRGVLPEAAIAEYRAALDAYRKIAERAR